jgi:phosphoglycolate phosphatase-like HAD superfamily hydrolase
VIALFDIDGTLITFRHADDDSPPGRKSFGRVCEQIFGRDYTEGLRFAGGTDLRLARIICECAGIEASRIEPTSRELLAKYVLVLAEDLRARSYQAIGDVAAMITELRAQKITIGLGTGNLKEAARMKVQSAGILEHFSLDFGGFGEDGADRSDILRAAIARCGGGDHVVVIGDTENDLLASKSVGARFVGVAATERSHSQLARVWDGPIVDRCGPELAGIVASELQKSVGDGS